MLPLVIRATVLAVALLACACAAPAAAPQPTATTAAKPAAPPTAASAASPSAPAASPAAKPAASPAASPGAAAAPASGGPTTRVAVAYSNLIVDNSPMWYAKDMGIYDRDGLDVDLQYIASTNAMAALLSGQVQIASTGGSEAINAVANGADLVVIATTTPVYTNFLMARPEIKTAEDLKGKSIAITNPGASFDITTRVLLEHEGLDPDRDVNLVKTGSVANQTSALISGNVDAGLANVPDNLKIAAAGMHPLFDLSSLGLPGSTNLLVTTRAFTTGQRDATQRFIDAWIEAFARMKKDKNGSIQVFEKYLQSQDTEGLTAAYDHYMQKVFPALPFPRSEQFVDAQKTTGAVNPKALEVRIESLLEPSFVQSAAERGIDKR